MLKIVHVINSMTIKIEHSDIDNVLLDKKSKNTFSLITISLLIALLVAGSIYCYLIKHWAK